MGYHKVTDPFYHSGAWLRVRQMALARDKHLCQECVRRVKMGLQSRPRNATMVHHIKPRKEYPELALVLENLESLCNTCHERLTPERRSRGRQQERSGQRVVRIGNEVKNDSG